MASGAWYQQQGLRRAIPGVTNNRVPGRGTMQSLRGGFQTNIPWQSTSSIFREYHRGQIRNSKSQFAGGWGYAWQGLAECADSILDYDGKNTKRIDAAVRKLANEMLEYAKTEAPWRDHPGEHEDARDNLQVAVIHDDKVGWQIYLGHGKNVYYGLWLEVRWGGKYAILAPTLHKFAPQMQQRIAVQT